MTTDLDFQLIKAQERYKEAEKIFLDHCSQVLAQKVDLEAKPLPIAGEYDYQMLWLEQNECLSDEDVWDKHIYEEQEAIEFLWYWKKSKMGRESEKRDTQKRIEEMIISNARIRSAVKGPTIMDRIVTLESKVDKLAEILESV